MKSISLLLLCLLGGAAHAQAQTQAQAPRTPAEVTLSQITLYQTGIELGCKDSGRKNGDSVQKVTAFCDCVIQVLKEDVTEDEWRRAFVFAAGGKFQDEARILDAHIGKTRSCRAESK